MESKYDIYMAMLRYSCLPFTSPSPVPQSWHRASQPCRHVGAEPPQGHGTEMPQRGEGGQNGPAWKNPLLPCSPGGTGWRLGYPSNWEAPPACPQQELLREAGPGLAAGQGGLMAILGDGWLCLGTGQETTFILCSALILRSKIF